MGERFAPTKVFTLVRQATAAEVTFMGEALCVAKTVVVSFVIHKHLLVLSLPNLIIQSIEMIPLMDVFLQSATPATMPVCRDYCIALAAA